MTEPSPVAEYAAPFMRAPGKIAEGMGSVLSAKIIGTPKDLVILVQMKNAGIWKMLADLFGGFLK